MKLAKRNKLPVLLPVPPVPNIRKRASAKSMNDILEKVIPNLIHKKGIKSEEVAIQTNFSG